MRNEREEKEKIVARMREKINNEIDAREILVRRKREK